MSDNRTRVFAVCPDCGLAYHQWITGPYIGPRKKVRLKDAELRIAATDAGQGTLANCWYGVMRCTRCSIRLVPPALRASLERWLLHGEDGTGAVSDLDR